MAGLVVLALTSCDEDNSLGTMQKYEAPIVVAADGVALQSLYSASGNSINLQTYEQAFNIPLVDIEIANTFPEGSTVTGEVEIADNADFNNAQTIALQAVEAPSPNSSLVQTLGVETRSLTGVVNVTAWNDAFVSFYGYNPAPNVNYLRYKLKLNNGSQNVILYNTNGEEWFDAMEFTVTPLDAQFDVALAYNLTYTVNGNSTTVVMYHNPDKHVYDDPVFNAMVDVPEGAELTWTISPADDSATVFGVEGDDATAASGTLVEGGTAGIIQTAGTHKIEANMLEKTYTVQVAPASLYVISMSEITFDKAAQLETTDYITYTGMAGIETAWGLAGQAAYKPTLYINNPAIDVTTSSNGTVSGGILPDVSGEPFTASTGIPMPGQRGLYYVTVNLQTQAYTAYRCSTMGVVGTINDWGNAGDDIKLNISRTTNYMVLTGTIEVTAEDQWKIRANSDWAVNFGATGDVEPAVVPTDGSHIELVKDGKNMSVAAPGKYNIEVYLRRTLVDGQMTPYYMTLTPAN